MKAKKILLGLLSILCFGFSAFSAISCDETGSDSSSNSNSISDSSDSTISSEEIISSESVSESEDSIPSVSSSEEVPHVHEWIIDEIILEATCTTKGATSYKCISCDETKNEVINAFGHSEITDEAVKSTCTETGLSEGKHCFTCNEILVKQEIIDKLEHNYVEQVLTIATCISDGVTLFTCSNCNHTKYEIIKATGHNEVIDEAVESTCTETGLTEGKHCSTCNEVLVKQEIVDVLGHEYGNLVTELLATCTENGTIAHYHCEECDTYFNENKNIVTDLVIVSLGHNYNNDWKYDLNHHWHECITCTGKDSIESHVPNINKATEDEDKICTICNFVIEKAFGHTHSMEYISAKEATCTEKGNVSYYYCNKCHLYFRDKNGNYQINNIYVDALGHSYEEEYSYNSTHHWYATSCGHIESILNFEEHSLIYGECQKCEYISYTKGLEYTISSDSTFYLVTGIGTAVDTNLVIPESYKNLPIRQIYTNAFRNCDEIESVVISNSIYYLGYGAFSDCDSLKYVKIGSKVSDWNDTIFSGCVLLEKIIVDENNQVYDSRNNCNGIVESETNTLIQACKNTIIPDSVTSIGESAFLNCSSLTSITIPDSVISIGLGAFYNCSSLISITIPDSVTSIGSSAFSGCSSLESVTIPDSVTSIGDYSFDGCSSLSSVTIGNNVTNIGKRAFEGCCSLTNITIPDSVTSIGDMAFAYCNSLESITIPDSVTSIGYGAFAGCSSLSSVTIGNSVTSIGNQAFSWCESLKSISIPDTVTSIGDYAFNGCSSLTDVYYTGTEEQWNNITINSGNDSLTNATIHFAEETVPVGSTIIIDFNGNVRSWIGYDYKAEEATTEINGFTFGYLQCKGNIGYNGGSDYLMMSKTYGSYFYNIDALPSDIVSIKFVTTDSASGTAVY